MTQEQLDALLAEIGGGRLAYAPQVETKTIPNPDRIDPDGETDYTKPREIQVTIKRWHDPVSGRVIEAYQGQSGWTITRNTTDKSLVNVGAPKEDTQSPASQRTAREEAEIARNAALPGPNPNGATEEERRGQDPRSETDADRAARAAATIKEQGVAARQAQLDAEAKAERERVAKRQEEADARAAAERNQPSAVSAPPTQAFIVDRLPDGSIRTVKNPNYTGDKPEAGKSLTIKGGDGKTYLVPIDAQGNAGEPKPLNIPGERPPSTTRYNPDTGEYEEITRDAQGNPVVRPVRREGQGATPTTRAPSLPQIIVGQSQDALRSAYDDIQAEVDAGRRTPAWGENRRKEVFETAQLAVNEAHLHEQSRQFNQTTAYNTANARMGNQQGVLEFAVRTALSINGRIKKGSSAGAELFRNLFMLGMQLQQDSGINSIRPGGGQSSVGNAPGQQNRAGNPTTRPPMDPGDTKAHAASADQAAASLAASADRPWTDNETGPSVVNPSQPMPATTVQPAVPPHLFDVGASPAPAASPPSAAPPPAPLASPQQAPGSGPKLRTQDPWGNEFELTQQQIDNRPANSPPLKIVGPAPQAMTPPEPRFAAMEQFRMPQVPLSAPMMDPMQTPGEMPAALRHADVLNTPPWRLDPSMLPDLVRDHGEEAVFSWPGMPREGAA